MSVFWFSGVNSVPCCFCSAHYLYFFYSHLFFLLKKICLQIIPCFFMSFLTDLLLILEVYFLSLHIVLFYTQNKINRIQKALFSSLKIKWLWLLWLSGLSTSLQTSVPGSILRHMAGWQARSPVEGMWEATTLSPSLPLSKNKNK